MAEIQKGRIPETRKPGFGVVSKSFVTYLEKIDFIRLTRLKVVLILKPAV